MKFNVEDKVLIKGGNGEVRIVRKWVITREGTKFYLDNSSRPYKESELELYKEEDKMEKTFKEVIADIKDGEAWVQTKENCVTGRISCIEGEIIIDLIQARSSFGTLGTYKLQRKEYTFEEAFKAYEEGKEIQSIATGVKCQRRRLPYENEIKDYCYYNDDLKEICKLNEFTINEIRNKWYINE